MNEIELSSEKLEDFQQRCMETFLKKENCLISSPSSTGKTFLVKEYIKNYIIENYSTILRSPKKMKIVLLFPYKAIAIQEFNSLVDFAEKKMIKIFLSVGGVKLNKETVMEANIIVGTFEKFYFILNLFPEIQKNLKILVIDEFHFLGYNRGKVIESILLKVKENKNTQIILLSSSIGNPEEIASWLGFKLLQYNKRLVPLELNIKKIEKSLIQEIFSISKANLPAIIFQNSRSKVEKLALELAKKRKDVLIKNFEEFFVNSPNLISIMEEVYFPDKLKEAISKRVAYHHAGLSDIVRVFVEQLFLSGEIDYLISTSTLSAGINLPAKMSIFVIERKQSEVDNNLIFQILGRAGRFEFQDKGIGILLIRPAYLKEYSDKLFDQRGKPIYSSLKSQFFDYDFLIKYFLVEIAFSKEPVSVRIEDLLKKIENSLWFYSNKEIFLVFNSKDVHYALFSQAYSSLDYEEIVDYYEKLDEAFGIKPSNLQLVSKQEKGKGNFSFIILENEKKYKVIMNLERRQCSCQSKYSNYLCRHQRFLIKMYPFMKEYWLNKYGIIDWLIDNGFLVRSKGMKVNPTLLGKISAKFFIHPYSFLHFLHLLIIYPNINFSSFFTKVVLFDEQIKRDIKSNELTNIQALQIFQLLVKQEPLTICSKYNISDSLLENWQEIYTKYKSLFFELKKLMGKNLAKGNFTNNFLTKNEVEETIR
ncbi:MAG: DEAD/DEAH box helicase [Candidatus Heimdallarchaeum aukensis]|uniref:DEAD/DEAH box helicase n=1 Tax=Candidatus Heimdallarchaeum aukensis TaxID=2876573 RepID=A0A9Y1BLJ4_9ARCH|nr:MAG: DEAD/DEAH box helicase [Candidatus Heimdallarchaeum aukensis]